MAGATTTITLEKLDKISPQNAKALGHILGQYGAYFVMIRPGKLTVVLPDELTDSLLMTVQRDVLPVEIEFPQ